MNTSNAVEVIQKQKCFDFTLIDEAKRKDVIEAVYAIKSEVAMAAERVVRIGQAISDLIEMTGANFSDICESELPYLDRRSVNRYVNAYKFATAHQLKNLNLIDPSAIYLLMRAETPVSISDIFKEKLEQGGTVKLADVKALIQDATVINDALTDELDEKKSEIGDLNRQLKQAKEKAETEELKARRVSEMIDRMAKNEADANNEIKAMAEDLRAHQDKLKAMENKFIEASKNQVVREVEKEIIPVGFKSIEEAIKELEHKRNEKAQAIEDANERLKKIRQELSEAENEKLALAENKAEVNKFYEAISQITETYTTKIISAMFSDSSKDTKQKLLKISKTLELLAKNIKDAA